MSLIARIVVACIAIVGTLPVWAQPAGKPNILVIWGDDIGQFNVGAYNMGMMGYKTPNIDSIGKDGAVFTDWYGQQSCTAGRAAFVTGQSPIRTGLTKVGLPGAPEGMKKEDPTIATLLRAQGYVTGQFGKNHLGDRDDMLPSNHGFDEFFGNLYHLNAEEEPENENYPKDPAFKKKFGPRGVIHSFADGRVTDTGPLTRKRMETIDDEVMAKSLDFMTRAKQSGKPFFIWWNSTRMHIFTHLKAASAGKTGLGVYADGMVEHDGHVGQLLAKLKELGLDQNTIVMYSTDNGAETFTWPDGGTTMFRGEKNTNWEGGYRVPTVIRWPGVIKPGTVVNDIGAHEDMLPTLVTAAGGKNFTEDLKKGTTMFRGEKNTNWEGGYRVPTVIRWPGVIKPGTVVNDVVAHEDMLPTLLAAAGNGDVTQQLLKGASVNGRNYKVHLDGYDLGPALRGEAAWPRKEFIYWTDDGSVAALRYGNFKVTFLEQDAEGLRVWQDPFKVLRAPLLTNLRMDPFERAEHENAMGYQRWYMEHMWAIAPAGAYVAQWLQSFREFPPRQKPGSFNLDRVMESVSQVPGNQ